MGMRQGSNGVLVGIVLWTEHRGCQLDLIRRSGKKTLSEFT